MPCSRTGPTRLQHESHLSRHRWRAELPTPPKPAQASLCGAAGPSGTAEARSRANRGGGRALLHVALRSRRTVQRKRWGIPFVDVIPDLPDRPRRDEILAWLDAHTE